MLRQWAGIVDLTPDSSPLIGPSPLPGLYLNCGWGTGGFKAIPAGGYLLAHLMAKGEHHEISRPFDLDRFRSGRLIDEPPVPAFRIEAIAMQSFPCPFCGARPETEFSYCAEAGKTRPEGDVAERMVALSLCRAQPQRRDAGDLGASDLRRILQHGARHGYACRGGFGLAAGADVTAKRIGAGEGSSAIPFRFDGRGVRRARGRHHRVGADRQPSAHRRAQLQIPPPRGVWGAGVEEPNAVFDVTLRGRTTPDVLGTTTRLAQGMEVRAGVAAPTAERDPRGALDRIARFLPAGFYYKTFIWPNWLTYEARIRRMAGLGHLDISHEPPADSPQVNWSCDVLVVGAGPAGLAAARAAARAGRRVVLVDDQTTPGGALNHRPARVEGVAGGDWAGGVVAELRARGAWVLTDATAYGIYQHNLVCVWERRADGPDALWRIRAGRIVVAAGAIERPLAFPDNDRPGVMSAEAALIYLKRHDLLVGERVVVATNNSGAYAVAAALREAGANVTLADLREGATLDAVHGRTVEAVTISGRRVEADALLVSGGRTPTIHLHAQAQGKLRYDEGRAALVPAAPVEGMSVRRRRQRGRSTSPPSSPKAPLRSTRPRPVARPPNPRIG